MLPARRYQPRPSTLFSPIFSLAREKIGPPEARQKRPRRNESLQARLLILCARFFLSKPQTEFAVWVFLCKSAATSQSRLRRASIPTPFVPSGHFPLIGGIGPWEGSLLGVADLQVAGDGFGGDGAGGGGAGGEIGGDVQRPRMASPAAFFSLTVPPGIIIGEKPSSLPR